MKSPRVFSTRAFSLVELLIAFFVLLIGILAILVLFPLGLRESKTMVDASQASFVARNVRSTMEVHPFTYNGNSKTGFGTASMIQAKYGPKGASGNQDSFPLMFPLNVLGSDADATFPLAKTDTAAFYRPERDLGSGVKMRDLLVSADNPQYSCDVRFTIGGGPGLTPPPGFGGLTPQQWQDQYFYWFSQYFKYYAAQISVYRNFKEIPIGPGRVWLKAADKPGGGGPYDVNDPNRPLYSEITVTNQPDADIVINTAIRIRDVDVGIPCRKSDWYRVTAVGFSGGTWTFKLDRPVAGIDIGTGTSVSYNLTDLIATNSLLESFTTMLGSQLDDVDTSSVTYP